MNTVMNGVYFLDASMAQMIKAVGGVFEDKKERPVVALVPSIECPEIFWAIPMGDLSHRSAEHRERINSYIQSDPQKIGSCFYHIGKTDKKSIFFISDVVPVIDKYVFRKYTKGNRHLVIKNKVLLAELNRKVARILAYEKAKIKTTGNFFFRQNIFGIYEELNKSLENE
ncbi:MAG: hypothetical protein IJ812_05240 [Schwartzia sp.]|nr:hypothetical protein [Schwartzia sp. (in: firmicutes)]